MGERKYPRIRNYGVTMYLTSLSLTFLSWNVGEVEGGSGKATIGKRHVCSRALHSSESPFSSAVVIQCCLLCAIHCTRKQVQKEWKLVNPQVEIYKLPEQHREGVLQTAG